MASVQRSGSSNVKLTWRGAQVLEEWKDQVGDGCLDLARDILDDLRATIHEVTGEMRRKAFAEVDLDGTKRTIRAGSDVPYAIFEEYRHPQIREVIDRQAPRLTQKIAAARKSR